MSTCLTCGNRTAGNAEFCSTACFHAGEAESDAPLAGESITDALASRPATYFACGLCDHREDDELDRIAAEHHGFTAACTVSDVTLQFGLGTDTTPRVLTWDAGQVFSFAPAIKEGLPE